MSRSRKLGLIIGGGLFLVGVALVFLYEPDTTPEEKPPPVRPAKTEVVQSAGQSVQRTFTGSVLAQDQVELSFRVSGPLVQLPVKSGDKVKAGDLIAQIDPRDFRSRIARIDGSLDEARAQLAAMKAGARDEDIRILENKVAAAEATYGNSKVELERYEQLYKGGTVSKSDYDSKRLQHDVDRKALDAAREELDKGRKGARQEDLDAQEAQIRGLEAQLKEAQDALDDTSLKAPFDGVVAKRLVENFEDVRAKQPVVSLQNIADVKIVADVPESVVAVVQREHIERLSVSFDSEPEKEYDVSIEEVVLEADRRTGTYAVTVTMPAPSDRRILPGMSAALRMHLTDSFKEAGGGVPVPADALFTDADGGSYVWVVDEGLRVKRTKVQPGDVTATRVIVREGLSGGERVVTAGVHMIQEGWKIRLLEADQGN